MAQRELNEQFWKAAAAGNFAEVEECKGKGADPTWFHPWEPPGRGYQWSALHVAADKNHFEVVKYLCETCNVDMQLKSPHGATALEHLTGEP
eukprot:7238524-Prymnesium_polylepis.1